MLTALSFEFNKGLVSNIKAAHLLTCVTMKFAFLGENIEMKKILSLLLALCMVFTLTSNAVFAVADEGVSTATSGVKDRESAVCDNHKEHDENCGYTEPEQGSPCGHLNEDGTYRCATDSDVAASYLCAHDDDCDFTQAVEGMPCTHDCEACGETNAQEQCACGVLCTQHEMNLDCSVCGVEGADVSLCEGTSDSPVPFALGTSDISTTLALSDATSDVYCAAGSGHTHDDIQFCWAWHIDGVTLDGKRYNGNVLLLNGVNITCTDDATGISLPEDTTIVTVAGTVNTVTAAKNESGDSYGIYGAGKLTFDGEGTLNVTGGESTGGGSYGIYAVGGVQIVGGAINATGATSSGSGGDDTYTVSFDSGGGTAIPAVMVLRGGTLTDLPIPAKSGSVFTGWYQDDTPVGTDTEFYADVTLVAGYETLSGNEIQYTDTNFTLSEAEPNLTFTVGAAGRTAEQVRAGLTLEVLDGSGDISLEVAGSGTTFTVSATDGFTPGGAYRLTLGSGMTFDEKDALVRSCEFTIIRAEVFEIEFNENLSYIQMGNLTNITQNGISVQELNSSLFLVTTDGEGQITKDTGTFQLTSGTLDVGDVVCLHSGEKPEVGDDAGFMDDSIAYVKVTDVNDGVYTYVSAEPEEVLLMPDVLPVSNTADTDNNPNNASITVPKATFDYSDTKYAEVGLNAATTVDKGDFLSFYSGTYGQSAAIIDYGRVTSVQLIAGFYIVAYEDATLQDIENALNYYSKNDIDADKLIENVDVNALEHDIERQAMDSGFAQAAASFLTAAATETDGFGDAIKGFDADSLRVTLEDGSEVSLAQLNTMGTAAKPVLTNLMVKAELTTNGDHFGKGSLQCALDVSFTLTMLDDDNSGINLTVSATFVEEVKMGVNTSGKTIWKWKWIFPYIADYQFNANLDVYNYTYIKLSAQVATKDGYSIADISSEMQSILAMTSGDEIKSGVSKLFEMYSDMMDAESDWVEIFEREISKTDIRLLLGIINVRITTSFVVSVDMKVALGMEFEYISGDRYCFWLRIKDKDAGSDTIRLIDQKSTFQFYVMGAVGVRAGVKIEIAVGLFSVDLASVGLGAETGAYVRLYGYFYYTTSSLNGVVTSSNTAGALYMEMGVYLDLSFKAQALGGKFQYSPSLYYKEWPIMKAGKQNNIYDFAAADGLADVNLKNNQKTFALPNNYFDLQYLDLKEGGISTIQAGGSDLEITSTSPAVTVSGSNITVTPPDGARYVNASVTVRYKNGQLAFTSMPITRTLNVHWDDLENPYHITFAGGGIPTITANFEAPITAPGNPTRVGYDFGGWYTDASLTNAYTIPATMPGENVTLYAKWIPQQVSYTVEHYQQALKGANPELTDTVIASGLAGSQATPALKSYPGFTAPATQTVTVNADGSTVVRYIYARNSYTLTFKPGYGSLPDIVRTVPFGGEIIPPSMAREGYTFDGWSQVPATTMPASNVTYTAKWAINTYDVEYTVDGAKVVEQSKAYNFGSPLYAPVPPTGYDFFGWYIDAACTIPFEQTTVPARDIKLFGRIAVVYKVEHYQESLTSGTYTLIETDTLNGKAGAMVTGLPKTYTGFTYNSGITGTIVSGKITSDSTLVLKLYYKRNSYTVTFNGNGSDGGEMQSQTFRYGETKKLAANKFTKTDYIFAGWNHSATGSGTSYKNEAEVQDLTVAAGGTITLYAQWGAAVAKIGSAAYISVQEAVDAVGNDQTIKLINDSEENIVIPDTKVHPFTLDLNDKTLDGGNNPTITHHGTGTLTITDTSIGKGGTVTSTVTTAKFGTIMLINGSLVVAGGTVSVIGDSETFLDDYSLNLFAASAVDCATNCSVNVSGGKVNANGANAYAIYGHSTGDTTVSGGEVSATGTMAVAIKGWGYRKVYVSEGEVRTSGVNSKAINNPTIYISGGTTTGSGSGAYGIDGGNGGMVLTGGTVIGERYGIYCSLGIEIPSGSSTVIVKSSGSVVSSPPKTIGEGIQVTASYSDSGSPTTEYNRGVSVNYRYLKFEYIPDPPTETGATTVGTSMQTERQFTPSNIGNSRMDGHFTSLDYNSVQDDPATMSVVSKKAEPEGGYGIYGSSITITGGTVTAAGDQAMSAAPTLSGYAGGYTATASVSIDGQDAVTYNPEDFYTYQYIHVEPAPSYGISLSQSGTHTFPGVTTGYVSQTPFAVTVSNAGNQVTGELTVALSGDDADHFVLSKESIPSISVSGSDTFTVAPITGLGEGTYTATVTVSGENDISSEFTVHFTVTAPVTVTSVTIKTAPKASYTEGDHLDLTDLVVELHKSDSTTEDVVFAAFADKGISVNPANDTVLTTSNTKVTISHTASGCTAEQSITVKVAAVRVTGITLNPKSIKLYSNTTSNTATVTTTVAPLNAADKSVVWQSSNPAVATVDAGGKVAAVSNGTATITATTTDGGFTDSCTVTVTTYRSGGGSGSSGGSSPDSAPSMGFSSATNDTGIGIDISGIDLPEGVTLVSPHIYGLPTSTSGRAWTLLLTKAPASVGRGGVLGGRSYLALYQFKLLDEHGKQVHNIGWTTIRLPIPQGANPDSLKVLYYDEKTRSFTNMGAWVENGYLVFRTSHFSYYMVTGVSENVPAIPETGGGNQNSTTRTADVLHALIPAIQGKRRRVVD